MGKYGKYVYVSDYGISKLSEKIGDAIDQPLTSFPRWFNRIFRPHFFEQIRAAEIAEEKLKTRIKEHWEAHGVAPEWVL